MKNFIGWTLLMFGLIGFAVEIDDLVSGPSTNTAIGFLMAAAFCAGGTALIRSVRRRNTRRLAAVAAQAPQRMTSSNLILRVARDRKGRITPAEVAAETTISIRQAKVELDKLVEDGFCQELVGESGVIVYRFPEFESTDAKRDVLDVSRDEFAEFDAALQEEEEFA